jgi:soluble lytic murein transglycosylase
MSLLVWQLATLLAWGTLVWEAGAQPGERDLTELVAPDAVQQSPTTTELLERAAREKERRLFAAAARTYAEVARRSTDLPDWAWLWSSTAAARAGDSALVRRGLDSTSAELRGRYGFAAELAWRESLPDAAAARAALEALLTQETDRDRQARILLALGRRSGTERQRFARDALRAAASWSIRAEAAARLNPAEESAADARLAGEALLRQGRVADAIRWLDRPGVMPATAAGRAGRDLEIGRALFQARRYEEAAARLARVRTGSGAVEAKFLRGRSEYRAGRYAEGWAHLRAVASGIPGTAWATRANHLLGDLSQDDGDLAAARQYFEAARLGNAGVAESGLAWMRLGALEFQARRYTVAARLYDEYRVRYPGGRRVEEAAYWAGRAHAAVGRDSLARARWQSLRDPLSYYTHLAAARLERNPPPIPAGASPVLPLGGRVSRRLALLRRFGSSGEGTFEASQLSSSMGSERQARLRLAATFVETGWMAQGIRLADLVRVQDGATALEVLRLLYPFPNRAIVEREARANGLDPMFVAGLIRQESLWDTRAISPAGARGLMQIMPETGRGLSGNPGSWNADVLYDPEISIRLGTRFLRDLKQQSGGRAVDVLAGYNAGPHRIARWRELPEGRDEELLAERIPFEETRHYVKVVQGNEQIYRALYRVADPAASNGEPRRGNVKPGNR